MLLPDTIISRILSFLSHDDWLSAWDSKFANESHFFIMANAHEPVAHLVCALKTWIFTLPEGHFAERMRQKTRFLPQLGITSKQLFWDFRSVSLFEAFLKEDYQGPLLHPLRVSVADEDSFMQLVKLMQANPWMRVSAMCVMNTPWPGHADLSLSNFSFDAIWIAYKLKRKWNHVNLCDCEQAWRYNRVWPLAARAVDLYASG
jgi:hypothetical protein